MNKTGEINCPFCNENDFDKIGLKYHLERHCKEYDNTLSVEEERKLFRLKDKLSHREVE